MPTGVYPRPHVAKRFWSKVDLKGPRDCWLWLGCKDQHGYGQFSLQGRKPRAHRVAYEFAIGPIPDGLVTDHLCRNASCVNPLHVEPVTHGENIRRSPIHNNRIKTHCKRGHLLLGENLLKREDGGRGCKTCKRDATRKTRDSRRVHGIDKQSIAT